MNSPSNPTKKKPGRKPKNPELFEAKKELVKVKQEIRERQAYQKTQENAVNEAVEGYNTQFRQLQADLATIARQKEEALHELADLQEQNRSEAQELSDNNDRLRQLTELYNEHVAQYKSDLNDYRVKLDQAKMNHKKVLDDTAHILRKLAEKEIEFTNRERIIVSREKQ